MSTTSLTRFAGSMRDPDPDGARRFAAKVWHEHGIAVFLPESIGRMAWQDRELIGALAAKLYGERETK
jgi:hypothetical protein